ncbi:MAG: 30S ribosomal protein S13 [Thermoplasmata archaeon]|nr:30S ribosomal protein S13 [Thermoplasmata archaeon]MCI4337802.1 30S ribosomal protein S13 [Thermoplasmata archaeon]
MPPCRGRRSGAATLLDDGAPEVVKREAFLGGRTRTTGASDERSRNARAGHHRRSGGSTGRRKLAGGITAPKPAKEQDATPAAEPEEEKSGKREKPEKGGKDKGAAKGKTSKAKTGPAEPKGKPIPDNPNFRYIVRMSGSDLDGRRPTALAVTGVRGVGLRVAEAACRIAQVNGAEMIGNLPETTVDGLEAVLNDLPNRVPAWMVNRPEEIPGGETRHVLGGDLETARRDDVNLLKMIRSYKGVRHERGQKVRGQRTRSNGRTGMAAGVLKKAAKEAAAAKEPSAGPAGAPAAAAPAAAPADKKAAPAEKKAAPAEKKGA